MNLLGLVALVTGSSRGIGKAIAVRLAQEGADIAVNYRSNEDEATHAAREIQALGRRAIAVQSDVTVPQAVLGLITTVTELLGPIDILINNVGDFFFKRLGETTHSEWCYVLNSNLSSVHYLCCAVLPGMRKRQKGRIVNIGLSPTYLVRGAPNVAVYSIAKTGVLILTRSLAVEEAPHGININCVSPGLIDNGYLPPQQREWMQKRVPIGRLGQPEDIAEAVAFLVSDKASYISGANLSVAGAWDWEDRPTHFDTDVHDLFLGSD